MAWKILDFIYRRKNNLKYENFLFPIKFSAPLADKKQKVDFYIT